MGVRGLRWSTILHRAGIETARSEPYALTVVGYMGNTVLPFRGGEALRVLLLREHSNAGWSNAIGSIIPERILDVLTLVMLLGALVFGGVVSVPGGATSIEVGAGALVALAVGLVLFRRLRRGGRLEALAGRIEPLAHASRLLLTPTGAWLALLSIVVWLLDGAIFYLVGESLAIGLSPPEAIGLAVAAAAFAAIPAGPAFAGTYDAALLFALAGLGVGASESLSLVILVRFVAFVPVMIAGLIVLVARYGGLSRLRAAPGAGTPPVAEPEQAG